MCTRLNLPDGRTVSELGELDLIRGRPTPVKPGYPIGMQRDICLCPADLRKVAKQEGWRLDWYTVPGDVFATVRRKQEGLDEA